LQLTFDLPLYAIEITMIPTLKRKNAIVITIKIAIATRISFRMLAILFNRYNQKQFVQSPLSFGLCQFPLPWKIANFHWHQKRIAELLPFLSVRFSGTKLAC